MKTILRLNENELYSVIKEAVSKIIKEMGGVYPDGQMDLFFDQQGVDDHRSSINSGSINALLKAEKECNWKHISMKNVGDYTEYVCCPSNEALSMDRKTFMETILKYIPVRKNIRFICDRNSFSKDFIVRIKNI